MEQLHIIIYGRVQGVFFRANAQKEALRLGLTGFVRNTMGGAVEAVAQGDRHAMEEFAGWCHRGSGDARVDRVVISWEPQQGEFSGFNIRH